MQSFHLGLEGGQIRVKDVGWLLCGEQGHGATWGLEAVSASQKLTGQDCLLIKSLGTERAAVGNVAPCSGSCSPPSAVALGCGQGRALRWMDL